MRGAHRSNVRFDATQKHPTPSARWRRAARQPSDQMTLAALVRLDAAPSSCGARAPLARLPCLPAGREAPSFQRRSKTCSTRPACGGHPIMNRSPLGSSYLPHIITRLRCRLPSNNVSRRFQNGSPHCTRPGRSRCFSLVGEKQPRLWAVRSNNQYALIIVFARFHIYAEDCTVAARRPVVLPAPWRITGCEAPSETPKAFYLYRQRRFTRKAQCRIFIVVAYVDATE